MRQILVTNDDGIAADGLRALADALAPLGRVTVVAPAEESSAVGHTASRCAGRLQLREAAPGWYSVDGTPADCVNIAVSEVIGAVPDLVVSGINNGLNIGDDVTYSGTVAGALEGVLLGTPAIAVSLQRGERMDHAGAGYIARQLVKRCCSKGCRIARCLNVNIPRTIPRGIRVTVQASRRQVFEVTGAGGSGRTSVWIDSAQARVGAMNDPTTRRYAGAGSRSRPCSRTGPTMARSMRSISSPNRRRLR